MLPSNEHFVYIDSYQSSNSKGETRHTRGSARWRHYLMLKTPAMPFASKPSAKNSNVPGLIGTK